jgi:histidinol-phosphate/aromatic aminotransferase/cobyric acid decarboxylase-like protein
VRRTIALKAITVNPVAPQSHRFDSRQLRDLIAAAVPDVPVLDVLDESYLALLK